VGAWLGVLEQLGFITVILNCIFIFYFRDSFAEQVVGLFAWMWNTIHLMYDGHENEEFYEMIESIEEGLDSDQETMKVIESETDVFLKNSETMRQFVIILISLEHLVILIKILMDKFIGDMPDWIKKR
jgi:hypothetical protein